mgnify:CR=1 FL=1
MLSIPPGTVRLMDSSRESAACFPASDSFLRLKPEPARDFLPPDAVRSAEASILRAFLRPQSAFWGIFRSARAARRHDLRFSAERFVAFFGKALGIMMLIY